MAAEKLVTHIRPMDTDAGAAPLRPLTERVLARLGPPRLLWMLAWGMLGFAAYEVSFRVFQVPTYPGPMVALSSAYVNLLSLWAIVRMSASLETVRPVVQRLTAGTAEGSLRAFQAVESVAGPVAVGVIMTVIWNMVDFVRHPGPVTASLIPIMFAAWMPVQTAVWFIAALLIGLHRLGAAPIQLVPFEEDLSLGLRPLGSLVFTAFGLLTIVSLPLLLVQRRDPRGAATNLMMYLGGVALVFASLHRLHRQMTTAKTMARARARRLYAEAFEPVRARWSLDITVEQSARLSTAETIERRAAAIQEWPLDEGLLTRFAAIVTSVVGVILARLILSRFGL